MKSPLLKVAIEPIPYREVTIWLWELKPGRWAVGVLKEAGKGPRFY